MKILPGTLWWLAVASASALAGLAGFVSGTEPSIQEETTPSASLARRDPKVGDFHDTDQPPQRSSVGLEAALKLFIQDPSESESLAALTRALWEVPDDEVPQTARRLVAILPLPALPGLNPLFLRWGRLDSAGALDFLLHGRPLYLRHFVRKVIEGAAQAHPEAALELIGRLPVQLRPAEPHPGMCASFTGMLSAPAALRSEAVHSIFSIWAERDRLRAFAHAQTLTGEHRTVALGAVMAVWMKADLTGAVDWFRQLPAGPDRSVALDYLFGPWCAADPDEAISYALSLPRGFDRSSALYKIAGSASTELSQRLPTLIAKLPPGSDSDYLMRFWLDELVKRHPSEGVRYLATVPFGSFRREALGRLLEDWSEKDLSAALQCAQQLPEPAERQWGIEALIDQWADEDPRSAAAWAMTHDAQSAATLPSEQPLVRVAEIWAKQDAAAALAWARQLGDASLRERVLPTVLGELAGENPAAAVRALSLLVGAQSQQEASARIAAHWADGDPVSAFQWVATWPASDHQTDVIESFVHFWAEKDREIAGQLMGQLPDGKAKDAGAAVYSRTVMEEDPTAAITWAESIANPKERGVVLREVIASWLGNDPAQAAHWINAHREFTPEQKKQLLAAPDQARRRGP